MKEGRREARDGLVISSDSTDKKAFSRRHFDKLTCLCLSLSLILWGYISQ